VSQPETQAAGSSATGKAAVSPINAGAKSFRTFAGTIDEHMQVIDVDGKVLGTVADVRGDQIMLETPDPETKELESLPVSLIDGIDKNAVLLAGRGDASFGLGAQP